MWVCREELPSLRRSSIRSDVLNLARIPTKSNVPEANWHASTKPDGFAACLSGRSDVSVRTDCCNFAYAESGGNPSSEPEPSLDEYAADASRYGNGTSKAVKASGSENQEADAAGTSSRLDVYTLPFTSFLPRSDCPLALPFIGDPPWLWECECECSCPWPCEWPWLCACPFACTASMFV